MASAIRCCRKRFAFSMPSVSKPSMYHADIGWECWVRGRQRAARAHDRIAAKAQGRPLRRHHFKAQEGSRGRTQPGAAGQRLPVLQSDRVDAAEVQPRRLHAAVPVLPRQSAEFHPQEARWRLRRAEGRCRRLPPEHRRTVCRCGVEQSAAAGARRAAHAREVQAIRECARRGPRDLRPHHHPSGGATHLRGGVSARAQVRLQVGHHLRETKRSARNIGHDGRGRQGSAEASTARFRCGPPISTRRPCG